MDEMDIYLTEHFSRVNVQPTFRPHINVDYPPNNKLIFEEWFRGNYVGCDTDRVYLDIMPTSYWVNHNYGNDQITREDFQKYIDGIDGNKKYFSICQYDDGFMLDWKGKDVLEFNMSKTNGVMLPLLCQPHPYNFKGSKKWLCNFIGSRTHPIRDSADKLKIYDGFYVSFDRLSIQSYCSILYDSIFTLCYRGYGLNSFRVAESMQYGSIPVYVSDEFVIPSWLDFESFGVIIKAEDVDRIAEIIESIEPEEIIAKQEKLAQVYKDHYTYEGALKDIVNYLETEYNSRG